MNGLPTTGSRETKRPLLNVTSVAKRFEATVALDDVTFDLFSGEVHCLVGENGAGKSTLVKIMAGSFYPDAGQIELNSVPVQIHSPQDALHRGIGVVYQELELVPDISVMENIFLGREPRNRWGAIDWAAVRKSAKEVLRLVGVNVLPEVEAGTLTVAEAQLVATAKVLAMRPRILVLDEPSAALAGQDLEMLFALIRQQRSQGVGIIYISHRLEEIFQIGDRVTVLRDGKVIATEPVRKVNEDQLIQWMVGRKPDFRFPPRPNSAQSKVALSVNQLSTEGLHDVSFVLHAGEILGCTGLAGCGVDSLARALVGLNRVHSGTVRIDGAKVRGLNPRRGLNMGIGLVPEDRKTQGFVPACTIADNMSYSVLTRNSRMGILHFRNLYSTINRFRGELRIKAASLQHKMTSLSGGNQQKVVLAKILAAGPVILILDEPTRGIDVAVKTELYETIVGLALKGRAIVFISSELMEVMALSHRLLVFSEGRVAAELSPPYDETTILRNAIPKRISNGASRTVEPQTMEGRS
jgi:ribose transport system ATP-binding protein